MKKKKPQKKAVSNQTSTALQSPLQIADNNAPVSPRISPRLHTLTASIQSSPKATKKPRINASKSVSLANSEIDEMYPEVKESGMKPSSSSNATVTQGDCFENSESVDNKTADGLSDDDQCTSLHPSKVGNPMMGMKRTFPALLYRILSAKHNTSIIDWMPDGRSFIIKRPVLFAQLIVPEYFNHCRYESFQRQLNLYGFRRQLSGLDTDGIYFHASFIRDSPQLISGIKRLAKPPSDEGEEVADTAAFKVYPSVYSSSGAVHPEVTASESSNTSVKSTSKSKIKEPKQLPSSSGKVDHSVESRSSSYHHDGENIIAYNAVNAARYHELPIVPIGRGIPPSSHSLIPTLGHHFAPSIHTQSSNFSSQYGPRLHQDGKTPSQSIHCPFAQGQLHGSTSIEEEDEILSHIRKHASDIHETANLLTLMSSSTQSGTMPPKFDHSV